MKPIIPRLPIYRKLLFSLLLLILRWKKKFYILLLLGAFFLSGCFKKFYSTGTNGNVDSTMIEKLNLANKYFIIHYKDSILALSKISIINNTISGNTGPLPKIHASHLNPKINETQDFKKADELPLLSEVHLYANCEKPETTNSPSIKVPLSDIYRIDVYELDKEETSHSTVLSIVGITFGASAIITLILAAMGELATVNF